jgi:hypothetical protein
MLSFLARRARPCDVSAPETAKTPLTPRALGSGRSRAEDTRGDKNLQRSGREEAGLSGRGNSCPAEVGGGACEIQRPKRHAGRACRSREEASTGHPLGALHLSTAGTGPIFKACGRAASFGRQAGTRQRQPLAPGRSRSDQSAPEATRRSRKSARPRYFLALAMTWPPSHRARAAQRSAGQCTRRPIAVAAADFVLQERLSDGWAGRRMRDASILRRVCTHPGSRPPD